MMCAATRPSPTSRSHASAPRPDSGIDCASLSANQDCDVTTTDELTTYQADSAALVMAFMALMAGAQPARPDHAQCDPAVFTCHVASPADSIV